jgi:hypothetical protein
MNAESAAEIQLENSVSRTKVDMTRLKAFAMEKLPQDWPLREILLSESNDLDISTFLARLPVYLKLARLNQGGRI